MAIFISYRRKTGSYLAELISQSLRSRGYKVFVDIHELKSGPFDQELKKQIKNSNDFLLLITEELFLSRINNQEDWVLQEIIEAYNTEKNIIPILGQGNSMPIESNLPIEISRLSKENSLQYNTTFPKASIEKLITCLKSKPSKKTPYFLNTLLLIIGILLFYFFTLYKKDATIPTPPPPEDRDRLTLIERNYQDDFLKSNKDINVLISEYKNKLDQNKTSPVYHYLLARLFCFAKQKEESIKLATIGAKFDSTYIWNRRLLLYSSSLQDYDLEKLLEIEINHYQLTKQEQENLVSGNPILMQSSFEEIKERNKSNLIINDDLEKFLCWHFFAGLNKMQLLNDSSFSELVDKSILSQGKTLRLKVLDLKTGVSALKMLDSISHVKLDKNQTAKISIIRKIEDNQKLFLDSFKLPPLAIKLQLSANFSEVVLKSTFNRSFSLFNHMAVPNQNFLNFLFGKDIELSKNNFAGMVHEYKSDIKSINNYDDFWVFFNIFPFKNTNGKRQSALNFDFDIELNNAYKTFGPIHDTFNLNSFDSKNYSKTNISIVEILKDYYSLKKTFTEKSLNKNINCTYQGTVTKLSKESPGLSSISLNLLGNQKHPIKLFLTSDIIFKSLMVGDIINFRGVIKEINPTEMIINALPLSVSKKEDKPFGNDKFVFYKNGNATEWKE